MYTSLKRRYFSQSNNKNYVYTIYFYRYLTTISNSKKVIDFFTFKIINLSMADLFTDSKLRRKKILQLSN